MDQSYYRKEVQSAQRAVKIAFAGVSPGECFYDNEGWICIKAECEDGTAFAVELETGDAWEFDDDYEVELVDVTYEVGE